MLRRDARSVRLKEGEHHVDDVANTLKRFFRDLGDGLFTGRWGQDWLRATGEPPWWGGGCWGVRFHGSAAAPFIVSSGLHGWAIRGVGAMGGEQSVPTLDPAQPRAPAWLGLSQGTEPDSAPLPDPVPGYRGGTHPAAKEP